MICERVLNTHTYTVRPQFTATLDVPPQVATSKQWLLLGFDCAWVCFFFKLLYLKLAPLNLVIVHACRKLHDIYTVFTFLRICLHTMYGLFVYTFAWVCVCVCVCVCIHVRACVRARGRARIIFPVSWLNFHNNYEAYSESKYRFAVKKIE